MRIALDAMGGDRAPEQIVKGAVEAVAELGLEVILVGRQSEIGLELDKIGRRSAGINACGAGVSVVHASEVVQMGEHPAMAVKQKQDSSVMVGMNLVKRREADAFVSAGNSGATMAAALMALGRMEGVERPAIGALLPSLSGKVFILDVGANTDCRPNYLVQFAYMGSLYMERVCGIEKPRVGLLSIGSEESKGNQLTQEVHGLLKVTDLNFVGNIEGNDISSGKVDVVVTDGFTGNIVLKLSESLGRTILKMIKGVIDGNFRYKMGALLLRPALKEATTLLDYTEYGGAPLLGVNGNVVIAHGHSDFKMIKNAVNSAKRVVEHNLLEAITISGKMI